jgi:hypothetical protein
MHLAILIIAVILVGGGIFVRNKITVESPPEEESSSLLPENELKPLDGLLDEVTICWIISSFSTAVGGEETDGDVCVVCWGCWGGSCISNMGI